jgi:hypothetical protein
MHDCGNALQVQEGTKQQLRTFIQGLSLAQAIDCDEVIGAHRYDLRHVTVVYTLPGDDATKMSVEYSHEALRQIREDNGTIVLEDCVFQSRLFMRHGDCGAPLCISQVPHAQHQRCAQLWFVPMSGADAAALPALRC